MSPDFPMSSPPAGPDSPPSTISTGTKRKAEQTDLDPLLPGSKTSRATNEFTAGPGDNSESDTSVELLSPNETGPLIGQKLLAALDPGANLRSSVAEVAKTVALIRLHANHAYSEIPAHLVSPVLAVVVELASELPSAPALQQKYTSAAACQDLLVTEPGLLNDVIEAILSENWADVLKHGQLRGSKEKSPVPRLGDDERLATSVAWETKYLGNCRDIFCSVLNDMNQNRESTVPYNNFCAIVQSSGTGKSRLVDETGKVIFALPFCLRNPEDTSGFPHSDKAVHDVLTTKRHDIVSREQMTEFYLLFFTELFRVVQKELEGLETQQSYEDFALLWHNHLSKKLPQGTKKDELYWTAARNTKYIPTDAKGKSEVITANAKEGARDLIVAIHAKSGQAASVRASTTRGPIRLFLSFDESHTLMDSQLPASDDPAASRTFFQILCSTLNTFTGFDLFCVFLSTNSKLSRLAPTQATWPSLRSGAQDTNNVHTPFVELPFDVWCDDDGRDYIISEDEKSLSEVCTVEHMSRHGRPMWSTRYRYGSDAVRQNIIDFAVLKLAPKRLVTGKNSQETQNDGMMAAVATRVLFTFEPGREASVSTEHRLVEGHMRIVYSVPGHREYLRSGEPSEPILAEAAARIMNDPERLNGKSVAHLVDIWMESGIIREDKAATGELVMRLLLTQAHDAAIEADALTRSSRPRMWSQGISVEAFLRGLLSASVVESVLNSRPDNTPNGEKLRDAFATAKVHFTHFGRAYDASMVNDEAAWMAMSRGMAVQCFFSQAAIDIFMPIILWDKKLGRYVMSGIFIQIKNRSRKQRVRIDAESLKFFSSLPDGPDRPYIAIVAQLGVQAPAQSKKKGPKTAGGKNKKPASGTRKASKNAAQTPPSDNDQQQSIPSPSHVDISTAGERTQPPRAQKKSKPTYARYAFDIVGCSSTVYNVVGPNEKDLYAKLLLSRDMLKEHPRQGEPLEAVWRLKPFWRGNALSFSWVKRASDSKIFGSSPKPTTGVEEKVVVHEYRDAGGEVDDESDGEGN